MSLETASYPQAPSQSPARSRHDLQQERALFQRYAVTRDPKAREEIVQRHLGLARKIASRFERTSVRYDDRLQVASLGLLKAIDRYDPDRGFAFSSFAVPTMVGELQRYVRDHTWTVRPPRDLQERALRVERAADAMAMRLGRAPTARDLAAEVALSVEDVLEALEAVAARGGASLEQAGGAEPDGTIGIPVGEDDAGFDRVQNAIVANDLLERLTPGQERVLRLRFEHDLTQSEIGRLVGCSQMRVSRILRGALEELSAYPELASAPCSTGRAAPDVS